MEDTPQQTATESTPAASTAEPDIMSLAAQADAGTLPETPTPDTKAKGEKPTGTPAEQGEPKPEAGTEKPPQDANKPTKPESNFEKARKDQERRDRSWKALNAQKEELDRRHADLEARERKLAEQEQQRAKPQPQGSQYSPEDYEALAKQYLEEGNTKLAQAAMQKAAEVRAQQAQQPANQPQQPAEPWKSPEFQAQWQKNLDEVTKTTPELAQEGSPLESLTFKLVQHPNYGRFFRADPSGIKVAVEVAGIIQEAKKAKGLQEELTKTKAEVERLTKLTALHPSNPAGAAPAKGIADMPTGEAEATMRRLAQAADRGEI